jgi:hypothetical protein
MLTHTRHGTHLGEGLGDAVEVLDRLVPCDLLLLDVPAGTEVLRGVERGHWLHRSAFVTVKTFRNICEWCVR